MENASVNPSELVSKLSEKEMVAMLTTLRDVFPEDIIQVFLVELEKRNLPAAQLLKLKQETESNRLTAPLPLGIFWKGIAFLLPFITIIFPGMVRANGYHRKARELKAWSMYGFFAYTIVVVLAELLTM